ADALRSSGRDEETALFGRTKKHPRWDEPSPPARVRKPQPMPNGEEAVFQLEGGAATMTTSAANSPSTVTIRPKASAASVCKTKMKAIAASAAPLGVPWPCRARIRTPRLNPAT